MLAFRQVRRAVGLSRQVIFGCARRSHHCRRPNMVRKVADRLEAPAHTTVLPAHEPDLRWCLRAGELGSFDHDRGRAQTNRARLPQGLHQSWEVLIQTTMKVPA